MKDKFIKMAFHWEECSFDTYALAYAEFGGNTISSPIVLDYISKHFDIDQKYYIHRSEVGAFDAAICTWDKSLAGEKNIARKHKIEIPVSFDEVIIPHKSLTQRLVIPFRCKNLSEENSPNVMNATTKLNSGREICIVKSIKGKSRPTLNRQLNQFLAKGGEIHKIRDISPDSFHDIYSTLFFERRHKVAESEQTRHFINNIDDILFGSYLSLNGEPCAAQLITKSEDLTTVYLDYINSGRNMNITEFSIGTMILPANSGHATK